ncbi:MAG: hypothetical protein WAV56_05110 [Microgenomates group bacterium]
MEVGESIRQQILDGILERNHLTQDQYELLAKHVGLENELESATISASRHPDMESMVDSIIATQEEVLEKIKQDPILEKAQKEYDHVVVRSQYENEP